MGGMAESQIKEMVLTMREGQLGETHRRRNMWKTQIQKPLMKRKMKKQEVRRKAKVLKKLTKEQMILRILLQRVQAMVNIIDPQEEVEKLHQNQKRMILKQMETVKIMFKKMVKMMLKMSIHQKTI